MMNAMNRLFLALATFMIAQPCSAASNDMIDISADKSLEWHQDEQLYYARGKAKAIKDKLVIEADLLTAHQRASEKGDSTKQKQGTNDIDIVTAEGHVYIHDDGQKVYGDKATYNMDTGIILITGSNLKYITKNDIVTAKKSLRYHEKKKVAMAEGNAIAEHNGTRIQGDKLVAYFIVNKAGGQEIKELHALNNVTIVTKGGEVSRGDKAVYNAKKDVAILTGKVRITQGETQLSGDKAAVNFKTGQSRLLNKGSGRVRVLLSTSGKKKQ